MAPALWVLAVLSTITVIHRISYTYTMSKGLRLNASAAATSALISEAQPTPIRPAARPGPVSGTASVSAAEQHELLSAPNAPRA
jgi:CDP-diacylglycerol--glycerol-3-phosphate 3-phosphatidyltransferase